MLGSVITVRGSPFTLCHQSDVSRSDRTEPSGRREGNEGTDGAAEMPRSRGNSSAVEGKQRRNRFHKVLIYWDFFYNVTATLGLTESVS